ncbi:hypothetical protein LRD18_11795 [Halorhodospira halochloris]|uniref:hypothetical protein n=1 Tax=Halorhodospira halochloris TaxID=1052 RepID=UPI001EE85CEA|nr:hypothetical protein [Halorhodospira halochloris]MCG5531526.1 hypothetical protein [Halorhodospira halochloris]
MQARRIRKMIRKGNAAEAYLRYEQIPSRKRSAIDGLLSSLEHERLRQGAREAERRRAAKRRREEERRARSRAEAESERERVRRAYEDDLERIARVRSEDGDAAKEAARTDWRVEQLDPALDSGERERVRELRKTAMWGAAVRKRLGCTRTELDRWDADGRLPHGIKRTVPAPKTTPGRKWFAEDVEAAAERVERWRQIDRERKRARRTRLRAV